MSSHVCQHTGKESSPKGLGHCAHLYAVNKRMLGKDENIWVVKSDKNGRLSWKKTSPLPFEPRKNTSSVVWGIKKPHNIKEAAKALTDLRKIMKDDDEFQELWDMYMEGPMPSKLFYPQKKLTVKPLKSLKCVSSSKGFIFGQGGLSKPLQLLYDSEDTDKWEISKKPNKYFYQAGSKVVTGTGADQVFEIV